MKITEQPSEYHNLERRSIGDILRIINDEDSLVPKRVREALSQIERLTKAYIKHLESGGRIFYIGTGTSGRLGVLDAAELIPTFGIPEGVVIGIIAGGDEALRRPVEYAEDDAEAGWLELLKHNVSDKDLVIGISASGTTPFTVGAVERAVQNGIETGCITCNPNTPLAKYSKHPVEVIVGPEVIAGSTRMKAGTAQKLVLNMISTTAMIKLGKILDNRMIDMQIVNKKLFNRGVNLIVEWTGVDPQIAEKLLLSEGSVRKALEKIKKDGIDFSG
ncbi:MAG: N-acetylmuramic acid 6-phosphate etherase [Chlorobi bacterium]|nr:N-acetylmuramic acid 6-phosphate etherase [Chlorobiota bacterium]